MAFRMNDNVLTTFQQQAVGFNNYTNSKFTDSVFMSKNAMRAVGTLMSKYCTIIYRDEVNFATNPVCNTDMGMSAKAYKVLRDFTAPWHAKIVLHCWSQLKDEDVESYLKGLHWVNLRVQSRSGTVDNWAPITNFLCRHKGLVQQLAISLDYLDEFTLEQLDLIEFTSLSGDLKDYHWEVLSHVKAHTYVFTESMDFYDFPPLFNIKNVIIREARLPQDVMTVSENLVKLFPNMSKLLLNFYTDGCTLVHPELQAIFQRLDEYNQLFKENFVQASLVLDDVSADKYTSWEQFPLDIKNLARLDDRIVMTNWRYCGMDKYNLKYKNTNFSFDITFF